MCPQRQRIYCSFFVRARPVRAMPLNSATVSATANNGKAFPRAGVCPGRQTCGIDRRFFRRSDRPSGTCSNGARLPIQGSAAAKHRHRRIQRAPPALRGEGIRPPPVPGGDGLNILAEPVWPRCWVEIAGGRMPRQDRRGTTCRPADGPSTARKKIGGRKLTLHPPPPPPYSPRFKQPQKKKQSWIKQL